MNIHEGKGKNTYIVVTHWKYLIEALPIGTTKCSQKEIKKNSQLWSNDKILLI